MAIASASTAAATLSWSSFSWLHSFEGPTNESSESPNARMPMVKTRKVKEEAQKVAKIFETVGAFKVKRKGGKGKQIFGSVTAQDLVDIIKAQLQRDLDKQIVSLPEIRETGEYVTELKFHPEITA